MKEEDSGHLWAKNSFRRHTDMKLITNMSIKLLKQDTNLHFPKETSNWPINVRCCSTPLVIMGMQL